MAFTSPEAERKARIVAIKTRSTHFQSKPTGATRPWILNTGRWDFSGQWINSEKWK